MFLNQQHCKKSTFKEKLFCFFAARTLLHLNLGFFSPVDNATVGGNVTQTFCFLEKLGLSAYSAFLTLNKELVTEVKNNILILSHKIQLHKNYQQ